MKLLDASALLAFINKEEGGITIKNLLDDAYHSGSAIFIHQVNFIEVKYKCNKNFGIDFTTALMAELDSPFFGVIKLIENAEAHYAATLKHRYGHSLADNIALSCAKFNEADFYTAHRALKETGEKEGINMQLIR
ncbi:PIN domain-containing protein [Candidatus Peregrinibacteria bacterium]|nr:PIN domain-containing protein [Candidatus Peregrinibacteria bacterium]